MKIKNIGGVAYIYDQETVLKQSFHKYLHLILIYQMWSAGAKLGGISCCYAHSALLLDTEALNHNHVLLLPPPLPVIERDDL